jgi:hypothetical protein
MSTHFAHDPAYDGPGMSPTTTYRDGPRGDSSPKCVGCGLPPSWHLAPNTKARKTLLCWNRERVHGKRSTWNTMGGVWRAPEGSIPPPGGEWRNLIYTLDMVRVDGSDPLTLADMRKRVAAQPRIRKPAPKRVTRASAPTESTPKRTPKPVTPTDEGIENVVHTPADIPTPVHRQRTQAQEVEYLLQQLLDQVLADKRKARRAARRARRMVRS